MPRMPGVFCHFDLVRYTPLVEQGFNLVCMCEHACVRMHCEHVLVCKYAYVSMYEFALVEQGLKLLCK